MDDSVLECIVMKGLMAYATRDSVSPFSTFMSNATIKLLWFPHVSNVWQFQVVGDASLVGYGTCYAIYTYFSALNE